VDSGWNSPNQPDLFYSYKYPKGDVITVEQKAYLQAYVDSFETACAASDFADPVNGYRKFIVDTTFMDFLLMQELSKSVDCYKRSAYFYKDKGSNGGKLHAGPLWDFNSAWHNIALCAEYDQYTGWAYEQSCWVNSSFPVPNWWEQLLQDTTFTNDLKCRWLNWRSNVLDTENIFNKLDSMTAYVEEAAVREYAQYGFTEDFLTEIENLKSWIGSRLTWLDENMPGTCWGPVTDVSEDAENTLSVFPNPSSGTFTVYNSKAGDYELEVYNSLGEMVLRQTKNGVQEIVKLDVPAGIYFLNIKYENSISTSKLVVSEQ